VEANCSWHRLFVDPLSRAMYSSKGPDFEYMKARRGGGRYPRCGVRPRVSQL
jgi:conjugal transfer ATP-binding protein TraC